ncbi:hypothetical protein APR03_000478 [Promicromonospora thailandica]|uniref:Uncharacterized protein n=1 Tax=Promicromonospora thailandica TaxID=765201 RepID=A0A9X2FXI0_9MICO|nr:hypothetical protein [Promicromonospora thailandica]BFF18540.1 hypothetical protein GCM10025730_20610 [Promicromonospora thailandica]
MPDNRRICGIMGTIQSVTCQETPMSKRGRKRRSRKGNAANHGKRPNA